MDFSVEGVVHPFVKDAQPEQLADVPGKYHAFLQALIWRESQQL